MFLVVCCMAVYEWPWEQQQKVKVCTALKNCGYLNSEQNDELSRIGQKVEMYQKLSPSEEMYIKSLIKEFGYCLNVS